jgi:leucyl aminopeptidase (aminopeptidase T)
MTEGDLDRAVSAVVRECLGVKEGEEVLVVADPITQGIGQRLRDEAAEVGAEGVLAVITERPSHGAEPPRTVAEAMAASDVLMAPTMQSLSHTAARKRATDNGARAATLPGVTEDMLARVMSADMEGLRSKGQAVAEALDRASEARITDANGTDLVLDISGRDAIPDAGELTEPGAFGNLPCGEGFISPVTGNGTLVVDGSLAGLGLAEEPVELVIEGGHLTSARGGQGMAFMDLLTVHGEDGTNIAELGVGTNEKAKLTGEILEDEKIAGTIHVAFGASAGIGGTVQVPVHLDCIVMKPTLELDGEAIVRDGELLLR